MPDCDYCEAEFDDEESYLDHLAAEHEGDLSRIDRRRVEDHTGGEGSSTATQAAFGVLGLVVVGALVAVFVLGNGGGGPTGPNVADVGNVSPSNFDETQQLPKRGNDTLLEAVQKFPEQGNARHVSAGSTVNYNQNPPLSGPHYSNAVPPGFYESTPSLPRLVHSLEHGNVVIYYEKSAMTTEVRKSLQNFVEAHPDGFAGVVVAPNPKEDPEAPFVLTAWRHRLYMDQYNPRVAFAFIAEYLGRGPEQKVR